MDRRFATRHATTDEEITLKLDYERPLGGKRMLTVGGSWSLSDQEVDRGFETISGPAGGIAPYARRLASQQDQAAIYTTLQFPALGWTLLPGLRYEAVDLDLDIPGVAPRIRDRDFFPSLHVSREMAKGTTVKFSYSRRVERRQSSDYDPRIEYSDTDSAWSGNPNLRPTFSDAYEAKLSRSAKGVSLDVTVYRRESHGEVTWINQLAPSGGVLGTQVNAGSIARRGGEASVRGSLGARLKYVATANLYQREGDRLDGGVLRRQTETSYDGSLQLDYKTAAPTNAEAQQFQVSLKVFGPNQRLQSRTSSFYQMDFTWRRPVTRRVSGVLTVSDLFQTQKFRSREWGTGFVDQSETRNSAPRVRLSLTYRIGGKP